MAEAFTPSAAQNAVISDQAAQEAGGGFDFTNGLQQLKAIATDIRNGRADTQELIDHANILKQKLIDRKISPEQAVAMIGNQLDKELPGLGRDILSGVSAFAGGVVTGGVPGMFGETGAYENVGNATATRTALKQAGFLR